MIIIINYLIDNGQVIFITSENADNNDVIKGYSDCNLCRWYNDNGNNIGNIYRWLEFWLW